jgi:N-acetylated-alpha-linked acidic dipeptidase
VAYLNVDVAVSGTSYGINASPSLAHLFLNVSDAIIDPDQTNRSLLGRLEEDSRVKEPHQALEASAIRSVGALGSGSDFTVFLQHLGIASSNVGYSRKRTDPGSSSPPPPLGFIC